MPESVLAPQLDIMALQSGPGMSPPPPDSPPPSSKSPRDSNWLQVEVCRDFRRDTCPRGDQCRFAHPEAKIIGRDGTVTCCYDFLKGRCQRDFCKYYHPPNHIKERLISSGKQFGAMFAAMMTNNPPPMPHAPFVAGQGWREYEVPACPVMAPYGASDRLPICRDFAAGLCQLPMCPFVHPGPYVHHNVDRTVTVCRNFMWGACTRGDKCRFFHPLPHHHHHLLQQQQQQQPLGFPSNQAFPMGHYPVYLPASPPAVPVGMVPAIPFVGSMIGPHVPMVPVIGPLSPTVPSHLIPPQTVMVPAPAPVTVIDIPPVVTNTDPVKPDNPVTD